MPFSDVLAQQGLNRWVELGNIRSGAGGIRWLYVAVYEKCLSFRGREAPHTQRESLVFVFAQDGRCMDSGHRVLSGSEQVIWPQALTAGTSGTFTIKMCKTYLVKLTGGGFARILFD